MYKVAKIEMTKNYTGDLVFSDLVLEFLFELYKNGQITYEYIVEEHGKKKIATVTLTDKDSMDSKYFKYVRIV